MTVTGHDVRRRVDNWRFWMVIAYFGIAITLIGFTITLVKTNSEETKRVASARATAIQSVTTCFAAVKNAPVVAGFIAGQQALIINGIDGNKAALKISQGAELKAVREASLKRLNIAKANNDILAALVKKTTPTNAKCVELATRTHVPYQSFIRNNAARQTLKGP